MRSSTSAIRFLISPEAARLDIADAIAQIILQTATGGAGLVCRFVKIRFHFILLKWMG